MYYIIWIAETLINTFIIITIVNMLLMGPFSLRLSGRPGHGEYHVTPRENSRKINGSFFELQGEVECAGFASAFLLRFMGYEAAGKEIYDSMTHKRRDGTVYPKAIVKLLRERGYSAKMCRGSLAALKERVSLGTPVIVMIRTFEGKSALHFVCVTGYDRDNIYLAETVPGLINAEGAYHSRAVPTEEFLRLWDTAMLKMPLYKNIMFETDR